MGNKMKKFFKLSQDEIYFIIPIIIAVILTVTNFPIIINVVIVALLIFIGIMVSRNVKENQTLSESVALLNDIQKQYPKEQLWPLKKQVPDLLPYLSNLKPQEDKLEQTIRHWNYRQLSNDEKHRPFLCLMSGEVNNDSKLKERLEKYFSVKLSFNNNRYQSIEEGYLQSNDDIKAIKLYPIDFKVEQLHQQIWQCLRNEVYFSDSSNWRREFARSLAKINSPVFIYAPIDIANGQCNIHPFIQEFIRFWYDDSEGWSKIVTEEPLFFKHPLVVCLFFRYQKTAIRKTVFRQPKMPFELSELGLLDFYKQYQAYGVVLPALSSVEKNDVLAWANNYRQTISRHCHCDIDAVIKGIEVLYKNPQRKIPMVTLGDKLKQILETP